MNKQHAHHMLDQLDASQLDAVSRLLEVLTDPVTTIGDAPVDDEPASEEEERAIAASKEWFKHNEGIPFEDVVASLGFTMDQIRDHKEPSWSGLHSPKRPKPTSAESRSQSP